MQKSKIHLIGYGYNAIIQDVNKKDIRVTVKKDDYVLISMLFKNGEIERQRSYESNGVQIPIEAKKILKQSVRVMKEMFVEFKYLRMSMIDEHFG